MKKYFLKNKKELESAVKDLKKVAEKVPSFKRLSEVLLTFSSNTLKLQATDLETSKALTIPVYTEDCSDDIKEGISVNVWALEKVIKNIKDDVFQLSISDSELSGHPSSLLIEQYLRSFSIVGSPLDEYPILPECKDLDTFKEISCEELYTALYRTSYCMSKDSSRPNLCTVAVLGSFFVATDGHRLARYESSFIIDDSQKSDEPFLIPFKAVKILETSLKNRKGTLLIERNKTNLFIRLNDSEDMVVKLVDEQYPEYNYVIPQSVPITIKINKESFMASLKCSESLSTEKYKMIKITPLDNSIVLETKEGEYGKFKETINAEVYNDNDNDNDGTRVGVNSTYILAFLKNSKRNIIKLKMKNETTQVILTDENRMTYVVMPMRF